MKYNRFVDWKKEEQSCILAAKEEKREYNSMANHQKNVASYGPIIGGVSIGGPSCCGLSASHPYPVSGVPWR